MDAFGSLSDNARKVLTAANAADSTLLITGATGTGKSHLAHAAHMASRRGSSGRWQKINLATLSENLIESELFGHERGAFTGADTRRVGKLELCAGGSVFLDEIGELSLRMQSKLLDFIQYKRVTPVGSNRDLQLDVRIIAATNRNLEAAVNRGEFRADLYHRLNVFHIELPSLLIRRDTILNMVKSFIFTFGGNLDKKIVAISKDVERVLLDHPWPGNIRELENAMEYATAMAKSNCIELGDLPPYLTARLCRSDESSSSSFVSAIKTLEVPMSLSFHETRDAFEKAYLENALRICSGQINLTSRRIGLNKVSLTSKIRQHEINWKKIRYEAVTSGIN